MTNTSIQGGIQFSWGPTFKQVLEDYGINYSCEEFSVRNGSTRVNINDKLVPGTYRVDTCGQVVLVLNAQ